MKISATNQQGHLLSEIFVSQSVTEPAWYYLEVNSDTLFSIETQTSPSANILIDLIAGIDENKGAGIYEIYEQPNRDNAKFINLDDNIIHKAEFYRGSDFPEFHRWSDELFMFSLSQKAEINLDIKNEILDWFHIQIHSAENYGSPLFAETTPSSTKVQLFPGEYYLRLVSDGSNGGNTKSTIEFSITSQILAFSEGGSDDDDSLTGSSGNDIILGFEGDDTLSGGDGDDVLSGGDGADLILAGAGNDTIIVGGSQTFSSSYQAVNTSSTTQVGTGDKVTLEGMLRVEDVIDGGADTDTIELGEGNIALFLHDAFSGFHSSVELSSDSTGEQSKARLENIEQITGSDGNNIIDLTSPDYSLAEQSIEVDGAGGRDIIWGSDADEIIIGGDGDDELFGGAGTNVLTGGAGADEFQFTMTSTNDSVTDFNAAEGDTLKFFNTGGATFDRDSITANSEGDGISIEYSHNDQTLSLDISLGLSSSSITNDLLSAIEII